MQKKALKIPKTGEIMEGRITLTSKGNGFFRNFDIEESIEIDHAHLNTALQGDTVEIIVGGKNRYEQFTGEVKKIISRGKYAHAGVIEEDKGAFFLNPQDRKMYTDIHIPKESLNGAKPGDKVVAVITEWNDPMKAPWGEVAEILGKPGDNDAEMRAIALERGFSERFPENVQKESREIKEKGIADIDIDGRRDFRNVLTFTIDPSDAKDFDDALSFVELPDGNFEIGIHIADVSYYVREGTELDREAEKRNTSVYLVDRVIPMLPEELSNDLCSLVERKDRLTMSAVFVMNKNGDVLSEWFGRTAINSNKRFSYEEAQAILDKKQGDFNKELLMLNSIAKKLHAKRFAKGAISLEQEEVKFILDEKGVPISVYTKVRTDTHKLIEEFMLLANEHVAEYVAKKEDKVFVYRVHGEPDKDKMLELSIFLRNLGFKVHLKDGLIPSVDLNRVTEELVGRPEEDTVQTHIVRSMQKAIYTTENIGHYGLAFDYYTHFTSPIRRYPDVLVHRLMNTYLRGGDVPKNKWGAFDKKCDYSSQREKEAADAERGSIKYKQVEYMSSRVGQTYDGIVSGMTEWGLYIEEAETKCEGMVKLRDLGDDFYSFDQKKYQVKGERTGKIFALGNKLKIRVKGADLFLKTIDYEIIG